MKSLTYYFIIFFSLSSFAQNDTTVNTSRENVPLQAVLNIESGKTLFAGQEYTFNITTSGDYQLRLTSKNAKIHLIENSKKSTGGLRYSVTPIDTGKLSITIWNVINEN
jgi:hypothetical protein